MKNCKTATGDAGRLSESDTGAKANLVWVSLLVTVDSNDTKLEFPAEIRISVEVAKKNQIHSNIVIFIAGIFEI